MSRSKTSFMQLVTMIRTRAKRHYMAMIRCERANDWKRAEQHSRTMDNMIRLENTLHDDMIMSIPRHERYPRQTRHFS